MSQTVDHREDGTSHFVFTCGCGDVEEITIPTEAYVSWKSGVHIQNAMACLDDDQRERFLSGLCNDCWEAWAQEMERLMEGRRDN
jgi:hypothetical protein